jgi:uncharacterized protein (TIGR03000 family)
MLKQWVSGALLAGLAAAALLLTPGESDAQVRVRMGGGRLGFSYGTPYYGYGYGYPGYRGGLYDGWRYGYSTYRPYYGGFYSQPYYSSGYYSYVRPYYGGFYAQPYYSMSGPVYYSQPATVTYGTPTTSYQAFYPPTGGYASQYQQPRDTALIDVTVPADAEIWFDGTKTQRTGRNRQFVTPPLKAEGGSYEVRASWTDENGKTVTRTRQVNVMPNRTVSVDFTRPEKSDE